MERIFWVENGNLSEVNNWLQKGGRVKSINPISERIASYGYAGGESIEDRDGYYVSNIYAYIVVEFD